MPTRKQPVISGSKIAGIVLGAGSARRMGRPKQLLPLAGRPLIHWAVLAAAASRLDRVIAVLGRCGSETAAALEGIVPPGRLEIVQNPHYREGQSTSLAAGLAAAGGRSCQGVVFLLADQPFVSPGHIDRLIGRRPIHPGTIRVSLPPSGVWRPPVLLGRSHFTALSGLTGDGGARSVIAARADLVETVAVADARELLDIDTPEDVKQAREHCLKFLAHP
jgi:molybdenum cofactor cytidylyltransferase